MKQKSWLNIIIILFIIFIIIPIILKLFNINLVEGLENLPADSSSSLNIINSNLKDICNNMFSDQDFDNKLNQANKTINDFSRIIGPKILEVVNNVSTKLDKQDSSKIEKLKCIANFGTNIGDDLPNGAGILTNTKYVCPSEYPSCKGLVCGEKYGNCFKD